MAGLELLCPAKREERAAFRGDVQGFEQERAVVADRPALDDVPDEAIGAAGEHRNAVGAGAPRHCLAYAIPLRL